MRTPWAKMADFAARKADFADKTGSNKGKNLIFRGNVAQNALHLDNWIPDSGFKIQDSGFKMSRFRIQDSRFRISGPAGLGAEIHAHTSMSLLEEVRM